MQKRSLEKEASEAEATRGAKRQRLMQKTIQKRASNAASTQESADVDRSASKKDSLFTETIVDPQDDKRRRRTRNVSSQLQDYITYLGRQINARWFLQAEEFGGGGDCLFHAIHGGLDELQKNHLNKYNEIQSKIKDLITTHQGLRRVAATAITTSEDEVFLNVLMNMRVDETAGGWNDAWSPTTEIVRSSLQVLADPEVTRVNAVDCDENQISCQMSDTTDMVRHVPNLSVRLADLREKVQNQLSRPGNIHWGTYSDIKNLSNILEIGFIVFPSAHLGTLDDAGWVYSISNTRADFSHWMMLYCKDVTHFQLATLTHESVSSQSVFLLNEVPEKIRQQYNINNKDMPMGSQESRGFR